MDYKIEYNKAVEFLGAILKYSKNKIHQNYNKSELSSDIVKNLLDFSPNPDVKDWLKYVDNNMSPFLRNEILFIINDLFGLLDICFYLIVTQNIEEPLELIRAIKELDNSILIKMTYEYYELTLPLDADDVTLKAALSKMYSEETASSFLQIKNFPNEYKKHIIEVFDSFYNLYYKPFEKQTYSYMEEKIKFHMELFEKDNIYFINHIGLGDYSKVVCKYDVIKIYVSFYIDIGLFYFFLGNNFVLLYGQDIERKLENKKSQDSYKALFKALSDDKRLEIIKMTSKRPWYNKELSDHFNLTTATLSYHLNLLLSLGILNFEPSYNNRYYYSTNKENLKKFFDMALKDLL